MHIMEYCKRVAIVLVNRPDASPNLSMHRALAISGLYKIQRRA